MRRAKIVIASVAAGALAGVTASAFAGSGVGGVFNLGVSNTVAAETSLSGNTAGGPQLRAENGATSQTAFGVLGRIKAANPGTQTAGVRGINSGTNGNGFGVWGFHQSGGAGVFGESTDGTGVVGKGSTVGGSFSSAVTGVYGCASPSGSPACPSSPFLGSEPVGGQFRTMAPNGVGLLACTGGGLCTATTGSPMAGEFFAFGSLAEGVEAFARGPGAIAGGFEVSGVNGVGVEGAATGPSAVGVLGRNFSGLAGRFEGNVHVTGTITRDYSAGTAKRAT